jgi:hypothetical protein
VEPGSWVSFPPKDTRLDLLFPTKTTCHPEERLSPNRPAIGRRDEGPQPTRLVSIERVNPFEGTRLIHAKRRNPVVPRMVPHVGNFPVTQISYIPVGRRPRALKIAVIINGDARPTERANRRNFTAKIS